MRLSVVAPFVIISLCIIIVSCTPRVTITNGTLVGSILQSRKGRNFTAFRGIPYARPPVGDLRFQAPQPPTSWTGVRSAETDGAICVQKNYDDPNVKSTGSEDCLFLNVYTPKLPRRSRRHAPKRFAVMVWSHGGGVEGAGHSMLYGPKFLLDHDIVLVTLNYRMGPLGLLSTADNVIPGNAGLKDHVQALRWVQENIAAFGGDPTKVTIFGESFGASNVHLLTLSPLARGLFHQVISQSGTAINQWPYHTAKSARENARRLARELNCPTDTSEKLLQCLRTKDAGDVMMQPADWPIFNGGPDLPFRAVIESPNPGAFLTDEPGKLMERGQFADVAWLNGVNAQEGALAAGALYSSPNQTNVKRLNNEFTELAPLANGLDRDCPKPILDDITRKMRQFYFGNKQIDESTRLNVVNMISDSVFKFASVTAAKLHRRGARSPVYYYQFSYRGTLSYSAFADPTRDYGVSHADELLYLFPVHEVLFPNRPMSQRDFQMVDVMTTMYTNFARFGKPVPSCTSTLPVIWEPVRTDALEMFSIQNPSSFKMTSNVFNDMINLWSNFQCRAGLSRTADLPTISPNKVPKIGKLNPRHQSNLFPIFFPLSLAFLNRHAVRWSHQVRVSTSLPKRRLKDNNSVQCKGSAMKFSVTSRVLVLLLWIYPLLAATRVKINDGILEGSILKSRNGKDIFAFQGIPYARPPVGSLRFTAPQLPVPWSGVRSAKSDGNVCLQKDTDSSRTIGSEDCLYINVYTPKLPNEQKKLSTPYPVMVWCHGGAWVAGSGSSNLYGPKYLLDHELVLVTFNYRLGPLGFLSTADDVLPGNYAMKDHVQALRWVRNNIAVFGGDPNQVTIAGESAGASAVHYLLLSPLAKGLFHRAISESGTAINSWSYSPPRFTRSHARRLARELGCSTETSQKILECLRTKNASTITIQPTNWQVFVGSPKVLWRPVKESNYSGAFLTDEPGELIKRREFAKVPWLSGTNTNEGSMLTSDIYSPPNHENVKRLNDEFGKLIPITLEMDPDCPKASLEIILRTISQYYLGNKTIDESNRMNLTDMYSHGLFQFPGVTAAKEHATSSTAYFYRFGYRSPNHISMIPYDPDRDYGVSHGDDLLYLFPFYEALFPNKTMGAQDFEMVDVMTMLWTNFVIHGEPLHEKTFKSSIEWTPVTTDAVETFVIESPTSLKMSTNIFKNMVDLWSSLPCRAGLSYTTKNHVS
ncbi:uncharacterized protein LOC135169897 [Diachasmimorpha longicaudata]|uniref:uncharacterized protein LOC135169897 n=1 Tax=Diachasmimorpha longicaudata TaxID=58733 RepID=UPI0030B8CBA8